MALDPKYFISPNLQENFTDKDTGCPLVNGTITFFEDEARTTPKDVFILSGTVPAYTYTNIANVVTLNNAGAASYLGTDIRIYYFPFDDEGASQLYFAEVRNEAGTLQLTREAWPNIVAQGSSGSNGDSAFTNYIPNGQYLSHNDLVDDGLIVSPITQIGYGNWTFERPGGSSAVDNVTFVRFASYITNPEAHPRYAVRVVNTGGGGGDGSKDIRVKFDDVNKFGSNEQQFTFKFQGKSTSGSFDVELVLIKNYGTGGSSTTETSIDTFTITGAYQSFSESFVFSDNTTSIGTLDDDFLQLAIRLPVGVVFEGEFTDFVLIEGEFANINFPDTTTRQSVSQFLGGAFPIPDSTGRDIYLHPRLTATGWEFDSTQIGMVYAKSTSSLEVGELFADGSAYITDDYSSDGIPFVRLQEKYFDPINLAPIYGTGSGYSIAYYPGAAVSSSTILFSNNDSGVINAVTDGAISTGFTFSIIHDSTAIDYGVNSWVTSPGNGWVQNKVAGSIHRVTGTDFTLDPLPATSGMGIGNEYLLRGTIYKEFLQGASPQYLEPLNVAQEFNISYVDGASLANGGGPGKYFTYRTTTAVFYVWYHTASETFPNLAEATGIRVNINSSDSVETIAEKTSFAMHDYQSSEIITIDASLMTPGSYFETDTITSSFYYWYTIDGGGTDPNVINRIGIQIDILSTDDSDTVANKTISAINSYQFAIPDYRGLILKGGMGSRVDIGLDDDLDIRFSRTNIKYGGNNISSEQLSMNRQHNHEKVIAASEVSTGDRPASNVIERLAVRTTYFVNTGLFTSSDGGTYSRPANAYINYVIKY